MGIVFLSSLVVVDQFNVKRIIPSKRKMMRQLARTDA